jgi:hypothetical protein
MYDEIRFLIESQQGNLRVGGFVSHEQQDQREEF